MTDIGQVISNSISGLEGAESTSDYSPDSTGTETETLDTSSDSGSDTATDETASLAENVQAPAEVETDELANELGINPKNKNNRIPYHRVQAIVKKAQEAHAAKLTEYETRLQQLQHFATPEFQEYLDQSSNAFRMLEESPEGFLNRLSEIDPRYAKLIRAQQAQAESAPAGLEPDIMLTDGTLGYSPAAMKQILDSTAASIEQRLEKKFQQEMGPVVNEHRQTQLMKGAVQKVRSQIEQAEQWPGFNDHRPEIHAALQNNRSLSLEQAYIQVVGPKFTANRDDIRKQVLAELNSKPRAAQGSMAPRTVAKQPASNGPRDIADVIRESIAGLE